MTLVRYSLISRLLLSRSHHNDTNTNRVFSLRGRLWSRVQLTIIYFPQAAIRNSYLISTTRVNLLPCLLLSTCARNQDIVELVVLRYVEIRIEGGIIRFVQYTQMVTHSITVWFKIKWSIIRHDYVQYGQNVWGQSYFLLQSSIVITDFLQPKTKLVKNI